MARCAPHLPASRLPTCAGRPPCRRAAVWLTLLTVLGCGGGPRASRDLRSELESEQGAAARQRAPDLVAQVEAALEAADEAEDDGDPAAAADHLTRARLYLEAAQAEAARVADERTRMQIEERVASVLDRARRDEGARAEIDRELARMAAARAAREELLRALEQAETDEGRPGRRGRVSLQEAADLRRAAAALRDRAAILLAAADALGASDTQREPAARALRESEAERRDPMAALQAADRARHEALRALGAARAALEGDPSDAPAALAEAARAEGFEALALPEGIAVEVEGLFSGRSTRVRAGAEGRLRRMASLIAAHPRGPVQVQVPDRGARAERLSRARGEALVRALVAAGVDAERLRVQPVPVSLSPDEPTTAARLVFVAHAVTHAPAASPSASD